MKYFAYGSNMSQERLENRIGLVKKFSGYFILEGYALKFNKKSKSSGDTSGKCNICKTDNNDKVYGVLYQIVCCSQIQELDKCEGVQDHYTRECIKIKNKHDITHDAATYIAKYISEEELKPYCWYKHHVLHGATVAELPQPYIDEIMNVKAKSDPDIERRKKELAIYFN